MSSRREFIKTVAAAGAAVALFKGFEGTAWAYSQSPMLRKFISPLPGLGASGIPVASANTTRFPGADFYDLAAVQFHQQMHPDLPNRTRLWGYMDRTTGKKAYLGPLVVAERNRPVVLRMNNNLPPHHPLPVDTTLMGADMGAAENRMTVHLHGGLVPWTSDGGPFSWFTPGARGAGTGAGESFLNGVPGIPGTAEYYYPNNQSARLMWYHDHAMGITRLNAYAGLAAGYLMTDPVVDALTSGSAPVVPPLQYTVPLIVQDKTFKQVSDQWGVPGDLWYPYQYECESPTGRWDCEAPSDGFGSTALPLPSVSCVPEFFADTPVINGEAYPYLEVEPRRYRFLILNGSQARFYNLNLFYAQNGDPTEANTSKPGPAFIQIGNECGLLPAPVVLNNPPVLMPTDADDCVDPAGPRNLLVAPAERADIIIDFSSCRPGDRLILFNDAPAPFPCGDTRNDYYTCDGDQTASGGAPNTKPGFGPNTRTMMQIRVVPLKGARDPFDFAKTYAALSAKTGLPTAYKDSHIPYGEPDLSPNGKHILFENKTLNEDFDSYGRLIQRVGTDQHLYSDSFGRNYMDAVTEVYNDGQTVVWDIYNTTGDVHPMHFHLANVQVIGRATFNLPENDPTSINFTPTSKFMPPDANYRGWKETVRTNPGEVTRVIMKFKLPTVPFPVPPSPRLGGNEYVWHCHILEHEEHDMMRPLVVL